jgi:cytochrome c-type biogenesis protein CcmH/NrfG
MAFLGQAYVRSGQLSKAVAVYEKALKTEPSFGWVKHTLLPAAQSGAK